MPVIIRVALICTALLAMSAQQAGAASFDKAIWGPVTRDGVSQFPIYRKLGVGIYESGLEWDHVAPTRPKHATDPNDPAYQWPTQVDQAVAEAGRYGIKVSLTLTHSPKWASGKAGGVWIPTHASDYANFAKAAARHYRTVHHWMIWGEPTRLGNLKPLDKTAPGRYAAMLDAAYGALKSVSGKNLVIGGDTFTVGEFSPVSWARKLKLPNGRRPRMDLWGHNPFTRRKPRLAGDPLAAGYVDFSSLDDFARELDRDFPGRHLRYFLSEYTVPTGHQNWLFNFFEPRQTAANWLADALRISRKWNRIAALGWYQLYDEDPRPAGDETLYGLLDRNGNQKPAYKAYRDG